MPPSARPSGAPRRLPGSTSAFGRPAPLSLRTERAGRPHRARRATPALEPPHRKVRNPIRRPGTETNLPASRRARIGWGRTTRLTEQELSSPASIPFDPFPPKAPPFRRAGPVAPGSFRPKPEGPESRTAARPRSEFESGCGRFRGTNPANCERRTMTAPAGCAL